MIPTFPNFKKLELTDQKDVEKLTSDFPPYSDFNFTSMWAWNISDSMTISQLNKNLVVVFNDYISGKSFTSFIGHNKIKETALELINFSKENYQTPYLKLIPEETATILMDSGFTVTPDTDSHDYVYSIAHLADMDKWPQSSSGKKIRQFIKTKPDYNVKQQLITETPQKEYLEIFEKWAKNKKIKNYFELNEYKALKRLLEITQKNIKIISLYLKDVLIGFTVTEILNNDNYAMSHFAKADTSQCPSVYDVLNWAEANILRKEGIKYYNWEQDLGIKGLRDSKLKYKPIFLLKKFNITFKTVT